MIHKIVLVFIYIGLCSSLLAQEQKMSTAEVERFKKELSLHSDIQTLAADFKQYKKVGYVKDEILSSGKFYLKYPNKLAWLYSYPTSYTMIFNDKKISIIENGKTKTANIGRSKQFEKISQAIQANVGEGKFESNDFSASYFQTPKTFVVKLDPIGKDLQKNIKQIVLILDKSTYRLQEINILEPSEGYTRFILTNHKVNIVIEDKLFAQ